MKINTITKDKVQTGTMGMKINNKNMKNLTIK